MYLSFMIDRRQKYGLARMVKDYLRVNTTKDKKMVKLKEIERAVANIQDSNINIK